MACFLPEQHHRTHTVHPRLHSLAMERVLRSRRMVSTALSAKCTSVISLPRSIFQIIRNSGREEPVLPSYSHEILLFLKDTRKLDICLKANQQSQPYRCPSCERSEGEEMGIPTGLTVHFLPDEGGNCSSVLVPRGWCPCISHGRCSWLAIWQPLWVYCCCC